MADFAERYYTSDDGLRLYYRDYPGPRGAALTVLCQPGLTRSSQDFEDLASHLAAHYRVLCADLRGRGKSAYAENAASYVPITYVKDMGRLLDDAGVKRAAVIGTSLGGIMAMLMAGVMRHRLAGVVLNDIGPDIDPKGVARIQSYVGKSVEIPDWPAAAAAIKTINSAAFPHYSDEQWLTFAHRTCVERDGKIVANYDPRIAEPFRQGATAAPSLWPFFGALNGLPVLAIRGELSDILSAETLAEMQTRVPGMRAITVAGVGHAPALDEPEALAAIDAFLAAVPARQSLIGRLAARLAAWRQTGRIMVELRQR